MSLTLSSTTVNRSDAYLALGNSILLNDLNNGQCPNPCIAGGAAWIPRWCRRLYNGGSKSTYICKIMQTRPNSDNKNNVRDDKEAEENFGEVRTYLYLINYGCLSKTLITNFFYWDQHQTITKRQLGWILGSKVIAQGVHHDSQLSEPWTVGTGHPQIMPFDSVLHSNLG